MLWERWQPGQSKANTSGLGGDGIAPKRRVSPISLGEQVQRSTLRADPLIRIYNHMSDPPFFDTLLRVPLSCPPQLPRDVIRLQRQSQPKSGGVVQHDFRVPNAEGLFNHLSLFPFLNTLVFRLKLRCDRGIPCGSCVKRGCGAICPDGNYMLGLLLETASAHRHLQGLLPLDRATGTSLRMFASCLVPTLHLGLYLHPPKNFTRRSQNCVLVSVISRMHSERRTRRIQMSLTQCYLTSYCVLKLLYNAKLPREIRRL